MSCVLLISCTQSSPLEGVWESQDGRLHVYTIEGKVGFELQHDYRNEYGVTDIGGLKYTSDSTADLFFRDGSVLKLTFIKESKNNMERYRFYTPSGNEDGLIWDRLKGPDAYKNDMEEKAIWAAISVILGEDNIKNNL